jgi:hydrogenase maturation factor
MADLAELKQLLLAANLDLDGFEVRSSGELRVSVPRQKLTQFADYLRALNFARPELIVGDCARDASGRCCRARQRHR